MQSLRGLRGLKRPTRAFASLPLTSSGCWHLPPRNPVPQFGKCGLQNRHAPAAWGTKCWARQVRWSSEAPQLEDTAELDKAMRASEATEPEDLQASLRDLFLQFDRDGDGVLTEADFRDMAVSFTHRCYSRARLADFLDQTGDPGPLSTTLERFLQICEAKGVPSIVALLGNLVNRVDQTSFPEGRGQEVFNRVIERLKGRLGGREAMRFPKEVIAIVGPPGGGKSAIVQGICNERGIFSSPVDFGRILASSPSPADLSVPLVEAAEKEDEFLVEKVFIELLTDPERYDSGAVVVGFPASTIQSECFKLLPEYMNDLIAECTSVEERRLFRRPVFRTVVLSTTEEISTERQMSRGAAGRKHNEVCKASGHGEYVNVKPTDKSLQLAAARYFFFREDTLRGVTPLKKCLVTFQYVHLQNDILSTCHAIQSDLKYQSSKELGPETYKSLSELPRADRVTQHARQKMVARLDSNLRNNEELFHSVIRVIEDEFLHILSTQALGGAATIRTQNPVFRDNQAVVILLDILSERGFQVVLDKERSLFPKFVDGETGEVLFEESRVLHLTIRFHKATIHGNRLN